MTNNKMFKKTKIVAEPFQLNGCSQSDYKMKNEQQVKNVQNNYQLQKGCGFEGCHSNMLVGSSM